MKARRIGIAIPMMSGHLERVYRGVLAYARERSNWSLRISPESHTVPVHWLRGWDGDGAIAMIESKKDARIARELSIPIVNIASVLADVGVARVSVDHQAVGCIAAQHFIEQGFHRLAYYGLRNVWYAEQRGEGFIREAARGGIKVDVHLGRTFTSAATQWDDELQKLTAWIAQLQTPIGLLALSDHRARLVIDACRDAGIVVPQQVAVVGVDNDEATCTVEPPTLSSVDCNTHEIGYQAARMLDALMKGRKPKSPRHIAPKPLLVRESSDTYATDDAVTADAISYIREHLSEPFDVQQVAEAVGVSRRWLEKHFAQSISTPPHAFINQLRAKRARELKRAQPKLTLKEIAHRCGLRDARRLRHILERHCD